MIKLSKGLGLSTLILGGAMGAAVFAQTPATDQSAAPAATQSTPSSSAAMNPNDSTTYATGQPLQNESREGFWGKMNPFARKKWVRREVDPVRDRVNELDQLQAKNANDIKDVDQRATAGINKAMMAANTADQHAAQAATAANAAQSTANTATTQEQALDGTVNNLDNYSQFGSTDVKFAPGRTMLGPQGKNDLDDLAQKLAGEKGYIIEIQGYSRHGMQASQAMADSVARYLVTEHQVPLYRIYRTGMGKAETTATAETGGTQQAGTQQADNDTMITNGVRVTLLHNSLATMGPAAASNTYPSSPAAATPSQTGSNQTGQPATNQ